MITNLQYEKLDQPFQIDDNLLTGNCRYNNSYRINLKLFLFTVGTELKIGRVQLYSLIEINDNICIIYTGRFSDILPWLTFDFTLDFSMIKHTYQSSLIHYEIIIFVANSLWIHHIFCQSLCYHYFFANLLLIHYLFREFTMNPLSLSRIQYEFIMLFANIR